MKTITACLLISLCFLLTACHPGIRPDVVNNTGQSLLVALVDPKLKETVCMVGNGQTIHIIVPYQLRVQRGSETWNYDLPPKLLPKNFRQQFGVNKFLEKFQIEPDGTINVLSLDSQGPVANPPSQPRGYPIRPK